MLMSFAGSIGTLMGSSGLSSALETVYGPVSVTHMLSGKEIAMFLRGNFLVESAFMIKLLSLLLPSSSKVPDETAGHPTPVFDVLTEKSQGDDNKLQTERPVDDEESLWFDTLTTSDSDCRKLTSDDLDKIRTLADGVEHFYENGTKHLAESGEFQLLKKMLEKLKQFRSQESRTAKLWVQYLSYIQITKDFIRAERTGNWSLHLQSVSNMLNLFAATGHVHYAKCARLYLQQMLDLEITFPWVHAKFKEGGFHTVRRSERFWAGLWTDLTIEQVMMRSIKSRCGLTRGHGITESVRTLWINTAHRCSSVHDAMTNLTLAKHKTSDQHIEIGISRRKKDTEALKKLVDWFENNNPFDPNYPALRSLSFGVTTSKEDNINCDAVEIVGKSIQKKLDTLSIEECKIKRTDQVKTLVHLHNGIKVDGNTVHLKPSVLFSRLILLVQKEANRTKYFEYPLTPEPASLFADGQMRKPDKAKLRNHLLGLEDHIDNPYPDVAVTDRGDLLYKTSWTHYNTYNDVAEGYLKHIKDNFKNPVIWVVFDGDSHIDSTKGEAHCRRDGGKRAASVTLKNTNMKVTCIKQEFLPNRENKMHLIKLLMTTFTKVGINVVQSSGDADVMICKKALQLAEQGNSVEVAGKDTDLLVILVHTGNKK